MDCGKLGLIFFLRDASILSFLLLFKDLSFFAGLIRVSHTRAYDAEPDQFSASTKEIEQPLENIPNLALFNATHTKAYPERSWMRNASYDTLDTNAGARTMAFTHTAIPFANSTSSVRKFGKNNTTRPRHTVLKYLEELWKPYLHHLSLNTHLEQMKKRADGKWVLTLRKPYVDQGSDMWWQEVYDAVIVASGHFTVPKIPNIDGLGEVSKAHPETFEHSKSWRSTDRYVNKVGQAMPVFNDKWHHSMV